MAKRLAAWLTVANLLAVPATAGELGELVLAMAKPAVPLSDSRLDAAQDYPLIADPTLAEWAAPAPAAGLSDADRRAYADFLEGKSRLEQAKHLPRPPQLEDDDTSHAFQALLALDASIARRDAPWTRLYRGIALTRLRIFAKAKAELTTAVQGLDAAGEGGATLLGRRYRDAAQAWGEGKDEVALALAGSCSATQTAPTDRLCAAVLCGTPADAPSDRHRAALQAGLDATLKALASASTNAVRSSNAFTCASQIGMADLRSEAMTRLLPLAVRGGLENEAFQAFAGAEPGLLRSGRKAEALVAFRTALPILRKRFGAPLLALHYATSPHLDENDVRARLTLLNLPRSQEQKVLQLSRASMKLDAALADLLLARGEEWRQRTTGNRVLRADQPLSFETLLLTAAGDDGINTLSTDGERLLGAVGTIAASVPADIAALVEAYLAAYAEAAALPGLPAGGQRTETAWLQMAPTLAGRLDRALAQRLSALPDDDRARAVSRLRALGLLALHGYLVADTAWVQDHSGHNVASTLAAVLNDPAAATAIDTLLTPGRPPGEQEATFSRLLDLARPHLEKTVLSPATVANSLDMAAAFHSAMRHCSAGIPSRQTCRRSEFRLARGIALVLTDTMPTDPDGEARTFVVKLMDGAAAQLSAEGKGEGEESKGNRMDAISAAAYRLMLDADRQQLTPNQRLAAALAVLMGTHDTQKATAATDMLAATATANGGIMNQMTNELGPILLLAQKSRAGTASPAASQALATAAATSPLHLALQLADVEWFAALSPEQLRTHLHDAERIHFGGDRRITATIAAIVMATEYAGARKLSTAQIKELCPFAGASAYRLTAVLPLHPRLAYLAPDMGVQVLPPPAPNADNQNGNFAFSIGAQTLGFDPSTVVASIQRSLTGPQAPRAFEMAALFAASARERQWAMFETVLRTDVTPDTTTALSIVAAQAILADDAPESLRQLAAAKLAPAQAVSPPEVIRLDIAAANFHLDRGIEHIGPEVSRWAARMANNDAAVDDSVPARHFLAEAEAAARRAHQDRAADTIAAIATCQGKQATCLQSLAKGGTRR
ncbi:MAG: hypothetical protein ACM3Q1_02170 [Bacteroidales bacterium]